MSSLALIGNNTALFDRRYGGEIDGHDVVARINRAAILFTRFFEYMSHGSKTDMWFMWRHKEYENVRFDKPRFQMQMAYWEELDDTSVKLYPKEAYSKLQNDLGAVPSTGLMVLDFLDAIPELDHISVYGFDWKATPTFTDPTRATDQMLNGSGALHDFHKEKAYCHDRFISDSKYQFRF